MRTTISCVLLVASLVVVRGWGAGKDETSPKNPGFSLPPAESSAATSRFSDKQIAHVLSWIREKAPECPSAVSEAVAQEFLEEVQQRSPEKLDQLASGSFPMQNFESMLLRHVATRLTGPSYAQAREEIARRRVTVVSTLAGLPAAKDVAGTMEKIRDGSSSQYRRLLEGRMDEDDLQLVLKKTNQSGLEKKESIADKPKVLTASDIVTEFSRHNQSGSSLQKLQAYVVEGRIKTPEGDQQDLLLFRMRPDCFKLVLRSNGSTRYILVGKDRRYWQYSKGNAPQGVPEQALGEKRYLADFADPLFVGEGFTFERLEDGVQDEKKIYRINVRRIDGTSFVARIDMETFREVGSEKPDRSIVRYSDFRDIGGVICAFREEITDAGGRKGAFELTRITPNPGLIRDFFDPPARTEIGYFELEGFLAPSSVAAMKFN